MQSTLKNVAMRRTRFDVAVVSDKVRQVRHWGPAYSDVVQFVHRLAVVVS